LKEVENSINPILENIIRIMMNDLLKRSVEQPIVLVI